MQHVGTPAEIHATYRKLNQEISQSDYKVNHSEWTIEEYDQTHQSESIISTDLCEPNVR